jgi:hypothetical protein
MKRFLPGLILASGLIWIPYLMPEFFSMGRPSVLVTILAQLGVILLGGLYFLLRQKYGPK